MLPLRDARSTRLEADIAEKTATEYRRDVYELTELDVAVLEGIYLLKRASVGYCDLSVWIDCSFETALAHAVARAQEGMPPAETMHVYRTIYSLPSNYISAATTRRPTRQRRQIATHYVGNDPRRLTRPLIAQPRSIGSEKARDFATSKSRARQVPWVWTRRRSVAERLRVALSRQQRERVANCRVRVRLETKRHDDALAWKQNAIG